MPIAGVVKKTTTIVLAIAAMVVILAYMSGAFHSKIVPGELTPPKKPLGELQTDSVHRIVHTDQVEVVGTLRARRRTDISARIVSTIGQMGIRAGERVEKGAVLIRLDDRDLQAQLEQARQGEAAAKATLEKTRQDYDRFRKLLAEGVISAQEFDQRQAAFQIAQAEMERAGQARKGAETLLSYTVIKSPVAGVVVDKLADIGDTITPGKPLLTIYDPTGLRLEAAVPEALATTLAVGSKLEMKIETADSPTPIKGTIEEIVPQAQATSRSILVKVAIPENVSGLVEGAFGRLMIPARERVRLCLARSAVREVGQLRFVDVVDENNHLERRQVQLGEHSEFGRVEVLSGLDAGERVALYGPPPEPHPFGAEPFSEGHEQ